MFPNKCDCKDEDMLITAAVDMIPVEIDDNAADVDFSFEAFDSGWK